MSIFIRKPFPELNVRPSENGQESQLKRVLGPVSLICMGVGAVVGAGLFSITGIVAANYAGSAIMLSFVIAAICCLFAGLCYAEFSSSIPTSGSAYTYSYLSMGEFVAWLIGWDLILEYCVAAITVSISWSRYLTFLLKEMGISLPTSLTACPYEGGILNLPAMLIIFLISLLLIRGTRQSSNFNIFIVFLKIGIILLFVGLGWKFIRTENFHPFLPPNTGTFGSFGVSGILRGAAIVFFAFLGFDSVSTLAQETRNPRRNMPLGILCTLAVVLLLYLGFSYVMTGVANYRLFAGQDGIAPVAIAINQMGHASADGGIVPAYPWLGKAILLAIIVGYCSVIMVTLLAQSRIFLSMSQDGLLPPLFGKIHPRFHTPAHSNLLLMLCAGGLAAFVPAEVAGEMTSIGTLFAFILVCFGVILRRKEEKSTPLPYNDKTFRVPFVPLIPILGIVSCLVVMLCLPADTWIRLVIWMLVGLDIYAGYGIRHSHLEPSTHRQGTRMLYVTGIIVSILCPLAGLWHGASTGWQGSHILLLLSVSVGSVHLLYFLYKLRKA